MRKTRSDDVSTPRAKKTHGSHVALSRSNVRYVYTTFCDVNEGEVEGRLAGRRWLEDYLPHLVYSCLTFGAVHGVWATRSPPGDGGLGAGLGGGGLGGGGIV